MTIFESLDFLYIPAPNIEESIKYYTEVLEGELLWKIHAYGVWLACINITKIKEEEAENDTKKTIPISIYSSC